MTDHVTSEAGVEAVTGKLKRATAALDQAAKERKLSGESEFGPADREALRGVIAELWHEDCEWFPLIAGVEGATTYRGRDGIMSFYEDFWGTFEVAYLEPEFRVVGNTVVYLSTMDLRARESGLELTRELGVVYEIDGEQIRIGRAYDSHAVALEAAEELNAKA